LVIFVRFTFFVQILLLALGFASFSLNVLGGEADNKENMISEILPEIEGTELGKNLKILENYYQQVNLRLNKQLKGEKGARDPFQSLVQQRARQLPSKNNGLSNSEINLNDTSLLNKLKSAVGDEVSSTGLRSFIGDSVPQPDIQLRGFMKVEGKNAALLEIKGLGVVVVRKNDKVGVARVGGGDTVIRIVDINKLSVSVEVGGLGERVLVE